MDRALDKKYNPNLQHPSDDDYLAQIEQYKTSNPQLYKYLLTNPWMYSKQAEFAPTFIQTLSEGFGDYSARNRYYADINSNAQNWLSEAVEKFRQQEYNEPVQQVARERAAGLNPDLDPSMVSPGSAAENDQPFIGPVPMSSDSAVADFGSGVMSFIGNIFSFGKEIQGLNLGMQNIVSNELGANKSAFDFVVNQIASNMPLHNDKGDALSAEERLAMVSTSSFDSWLDAASKVDYSSYSRPTRKLIKKYYGILKRGDSLAVKDVQSRLRKQILENDKASVAVMGSPIYNEDFNEWISSFMNKVGNIEYDLYKVRVDAEKKGYESEAVNAEVQKAKENAWNQLYKACSGNKWYNTAALIFLPILRMYLERGFSFSRSNGVSNSYSRNGSSHSESSSFSLGL